MLNKYSYAKPCHSEQSEEPPYRRLLLPVLAFLMFTPMLKAVVATAPAKGVAVTTNEADHRIDITIDGKPFTSYLWQTNQRKPVLFPLISPDGTIVTRGYPFAMRPGERVDHPHHAGLWFNYGNANNFDFWNNSDAVKPADQPKYGAIHQDHIVSTKSGANAGELVTESTWTTAAGNNILTQTTRYVFSRTTIAGQPARSIDMIVTLKALDKVVFNDDKEGLLGIRVAHFLESPTEKGGTFMDANGVATTVKAADTTGATGVYHTSEGVTGDAVWSTRGKWCTLTGNQDGKTETIAILDHTGNPGYPAYWHARGYGLFAVNPLGVHVFDPKTPAMNFTIEKGNSATFKYQILILSAAAPDAEMNKAANAFDAEYR
jgi:Methane oxygenase PmoA